MKKEIERDKEEEKREIDRKKEVSKRQHMSGILIKV